jgi:NTE family protein
VNSWFQNKEIEEDREPNIFDVIANSINIMEYQITQNRLQTHPPDILIRPNVAHLNLFDYDESEATIRSGYESTIKQLPEIKEALYGLNTS